MVFIDRETIKSLHIPMIMEMIKPFSEPGKRLKSNVKPFTRGIEDELRKEYHKVSILMEGLRSDREVRLILPSYLRKIENIRQTFSKATTAKTLELTDIYEIKSFLYYYEKIRAYLGKKKIKGLVNFIPLEELLSLLDPEEQEIPAFHLSSRYSKNLAGIRLKISEISKRIETLVNERLEEAKKELKLSAVEKQIVVSRQNKKLLHKLDNSQLFTVSEENFANLTFVLRQPGEVVLLEKEMNVLRQKLEDEEIRVRTRITAKIAARGNDLLSALNETAKLDYLLARAIFGLETQGIIPSIKKHAEPEASPNIFSFIKAVNLYTGKHLKILKLKYQPVDICFSEKINIITGANMAGKSTILKTIGQLFYLTAFAIPIPCQEAELPLVDFIFFSSDAESSHRTDLSSFASELIAINDAINQQGKGLFLLDEFARGTNPQEGEAFARAIPEMFVDKESLVVSATHFTTPSLISKAGHFRVAGLTKDDYTKLKETLSPADREKKDDLKNRIEELHRYMNYQLEAVKRSNIPPRAALMIAEVLGINESVLEKVQRFLKDKDR